MSPVSAWVWVLEIDYGVETVLNWSLNHTAPWAPLFLIHHQKNDLAMSLE